jgi:hypothetical protein
MPVMLLLMNLLMGAIIYFAKDTYHRITTDLDSMDQRVDVLEVADAKIAGNRFTSQDWATAKSQIDEDRAILDRRVTRLEEAIPFIKESLIRIENSVKQ